MVLSPHVYIMQERRSRLSFIYYSVNIIQENWNTNKKVISYFCLSRIFFIFKFQLMQRFKKYMLGIFCRISRILSCLLINAFYTLYKRQKSVVLLVFAEYKYGTLVWNIIKYQKLLLYIIVSFRPILFRPRFLQFC